MALSAGLFIAVCSIPSGQSNVAASIAGMDTILDQFTGGKGNPRHGDAASTSSAAHPGSSIYGGPSFSGFNCFADHKPSLLKMPSACRTQQGKPTYSMSEKMKMVQVDLYQAANTRPFTGRFCRVEKSSSSFLCGTQDWTSVLSPPIIGETEVLSGPACQDVFNTKTFSDSAYHRKFEVKVPGVTVYAYTGRGTLQTSGQSIYCYGTTGRILNGDTVSNSLVFLSYRITLGEIEGRREVHGDRGAVITGGPLAGVSIKSEEVSGRTIILGAVTILLDTNYHDETCPLAPIRRSLTMFVIPHAGREPGSLSTHPGDRVYSINGRRGTPPGGFQNYTLLVTGAQDLVLNLGSERRMPDTCGSSRYLETSHSHVLATLNEEKDREVALLPLDLELVEATSEYSARLDLLSFITQVSLSNLKSRYMSDTCLGDAEQLAGLLERAAVETAEGTYRLVPAGEVIYRVFCPRISLGADWAEGGRRNCSDLLPVRVISDTHYLEGRQFFLMPNTRYLVRHEDGKGCADMPTAYVSDDGSYYEWTGGQLRLSDPQPSGEADLSHLLPSGIPDITSRVAGGKEIYNKQEEEAAISRLDFGVFVHGASEDTLDQQGRGQTADRGGMGSGSTRPWTTLPGVGINPELLEHPAMAPLIWIWDKVGFPVWHLLLTAGAISGFVSALSWLWGLLLQARALLALGSSLKGSSLPARGLDLLALTASATARAKRIQEAEAEQQEDRILRAQARARAFSVTSLQHCQDHPGILE